MTLRIKESFVIAVEDPVKTVSEIILIPTENYTLHIRDNPGSLIRDGEYGYTVS